MVDPKTIPPVTDRFLIACLADMMSFWPEMSYETACVYAKDRFAIDLRPEIYWKAQDSIDVQEVEDTRVYRQYAEALILDTVCRFGVDGLPPQKICGMALAGLRSRGFDFPSMEKRVSSWTNFLLSQLRPLKSDLAALWKMRSRLWSGIE